MISGPLELPGIIRPKVAKARETSGHSSKVPDTHPSAACSIASLWGEDESAVMNYTTTKPH